MTDEKDDMPDTAAAEQSYGAAARKQWLMQLLDGRDFSPRQLAVARFVETNVYVAETRTASEVARLAGVNIATVVRFAQALGFSGWPAFQIELRSQDLSSLSRDEIAQRRAQTQGANPVEATLLSDIDNIRSALETVTPTQVQAVARLIAEARRTVIVSAGSFAAVGHILAFNASLMGFPVTLMSQGGPELAVAVAGLDERDCVLGINFWRLARSVVSAVESAHARGVPTAVMTDSVLYPFAKAAEHTLVVPAASVTSFQSLTAAVSVAYAVLADLRRLGGEAANQHSQHVLDLYLELDVLEKP